MSVPGGRGGREGGRSRCHMSVRSQCFGRRETNPELIHRAGTRVRVGETSACIKRASVFPSVCPCHSAAHCASSSSSSSSSAQRSRLITLSHEVYSFPIPDPPSPHPPPYPPPYPPPHPPPYHPPHPPFPLPRPIDIIIRFLFLGAKNPKKTRCT